MTGGREETYDNSGQPAGTGTAMVPVTAAFSENRAFLQFAGFMSGLTDSFYDFYSVPATQWNSTLRVGGDFANGWSGVPSTAQSGSQDSITGTQLQINLVPGLPGSTLPSDFFIKVFYPPPGLPTAGGTMIPGTDGFDAAPPACSPTGATCTLTFYNDQPKTYGLADLPGPFTAIVTPIYPYSALLTGVTPTLDDVVHQTGLPPDAFLQSETFNFAGQSFNAIHIETPIVAQFQERWNAFIQNNSTNIAQDNCFEKLPAPNPADMAEFAPGVELAEATVHLAAASGARP
jgi:hypothetical protein